MLAEGCTPQISIHAAREGGDVPFPRACSPCQPISIHAAREGGDDSVQIRKFAHVISIHAAREGGDDYVVHLHCLSKFQSTPPVKAATYSPRLR